MAIDNYVLDRNPYGYLAQLRKKPKVWTHCDLTGTDKTIFNLIRAECRIRSYSFYKKLSQDDAESQFGPHTNFSHITECLVDNYAVAYLTGLHPEVCQKAVNSLCSKGLLCSIYDEEKYPVYNGHTQFYMLFLAASVAKVWKITNGYESRYKPTGHNWVHIIQLEYEDRQRRQLAFKLTLERDQEKKRQSEMIAEMQRLDRERKASTHGYVYLIQKENTNIYKIGKSVEPEVRLRKFDVVLPFPIEPIHIIECDNYHFSERELHQRYSIQRKAGEWFELTPEQVAEIKAITRM